MPVSLLMSRRFGLIIGPLISIIGLGVTLMTSKFLLLGTCIAIGGLLIPLPSFWADLRKTRIVLVSGAPSAPQVDRLPLDLWGYLAACIIVLCITGYIFRFFDSFREDPKMLW